MIKINSVFSMKKDPHCWTLTEVQNKYSEKRGDYKSTRDTYHANIKQVAETILERTAGECESMEDIIYLFEHAVDQIINEIKGKMEPVKKRKRVRS